jgi:hypothetical protein
MKITQIITRVYPYTHRIELDDINKTHNEYLVLLDVVGQYCIDNAVPHLWCGNKLYVKKEGATLIYLKFS